MKSIEKPMKSIEKSMQIPLFIGHEIASRLWQAMSMAHRLAIEKKGGAIHRCHEFIY